MRQDFFEYVPQFKLVIAGNHKPGLRNVDEAIRRRLHLIPFTITIGEQERDPNLGEKLKSEYPGILRWAIEGCLAWQGDGLNPPAAVRDATVTLSPSVIRSRNRSQSEQSRHEASPAEACQVCGMLLMSANTTSRSKQPPALVV